MPKYICTTCGVQHADSVLPPEHCAICEDDRQYVGPGGQKWTTLKEMGATRRNQLNVEGPELISIATEPRFAIGQRALHVRAEIGILWDCISFLDDRSAVRVRRDLRSMVRSEHPGKCQGSSALFSQSLFGRDLRAAVILSGCEGSPNETYVRDGRSEPGRSVRFAQDDSQ